MNDFTKAYTGTRYVQTRRGDTLQLIAYRELGDANEWAKLVWFNDLIAPFITDDEALAGPRVILAGGLIKIPASAADGTTASDGENALLTDCRLSRGRLTIDSATGDIAVVAGRDNLKQALAHRFITDVGELIYHPEYGCKLQRRKGGKNNAVMSLIGRMDAQSAAAQEPRLKSINSITVTSSGDALIVQADVSPISGDSVTVDANV